jgi:hypothetical protein
MRHGTTNFKVIALEEDTLRRQALNIYASGPMAGVSDRYTFRAPDLNGKRIR